MELEMDEKYQQAIRYWTLAQPLVSAYVTAVVRDFRDRDDVLQAISVAILESFRNYDSSRQFTSWAMGIARNQVETYLRERRRNRLVFDAETVELLAVAFEEVEADQNRTRDYLQECLGKLEGRARQMCELRYENDLKPSAIAGLVREELVFHFPHYQSDDGPHSSIRLGNLKLLYFYEDERALLFDLSKDIGERNDLAAQMPKETEMLKTRLSNYLTAINAQLPTKNTEFDPTQPATPRKGGKGGKGAKKGMDKK